ncbi:Cytochrome c551/c552 [Indibacter alkaliphilus LW1]|uniref:Cytochrome c551/c552 n=1 Tax=Indibacter alkaliphilus (strain CCUG 57479 / KCTC 22604 / LW1) TaxID=1189612 RepID=S2DEB7_INDAL|nr:ThuA domain-containing protein [Indibacter alkaliphilus]EOZ95350.1 Cytochrome c551/c552 [Indibacter alkaliphilus LW1]
MKFPIYFLSFLISVSTLQAQRVLVYTHNGKGYVHDNIEASNKALAAFGKENGYEILFSDEPDFFNKENLEKISLIIFNNTNNEAFYTSEQRNAFRSFIENGGAFTGIHISTGSERDWPWFWEMQGGKFKSHPQFQEFEIKVIDHSHPSTSFMEDVWTWEDECYYFDQLNPAINILLAADLRTIEDPEKSTYPGTVFGNYTPIAWYHHFGNSRVFYTALGHEAAHYENVFFRKHLFAGIKWALGDE